jgi:hypothetical protein
MALHTCIQVYKANPTGILTAAQLAHAMQVTPLYTPQKLGALGNIVLESQIGSVVAGQAILTITLGINTPEFRTRFPSIGEGLGQGGFLGNFTGQLQASVSQPVLAEAPVFL